MLERLNFKIVAVGQSNTGKTSLIYKYIKGEFKLQYNVTLGIQFYTKLQNIGTDIIQFQIWDTAGQEHFKSIVRTFYRGAAAVLLVFALNQYNSLKQLQYWQKQVKEHVHPQAKIFLIGTKLDLNKRDVSKQQIDEFMNKIPNLSYFETSSKTGKNIQQYCKIAPNKIQRKQIILVASEPQGLKSQYPLQQFQLKQHYKTAKKNKSRTIQSR